MAVSEDVITNDLWSWDVQTRFWVWLGGSRTNGDPGFYGIKNVTTSQNMPPARYFHTMVHVPAADQLIVFGGTGQSKAAIFPLQFLLTKHVVYPTNPDGLIEYMSELWSYDIGRKMWTWIGGNQSTNDPGWPGTMGVESPDNRPQARDRHAMVYHQAMDSIFIFGGEGYHGAGRHLMCRQVTLFSLIPHMHG